MKPLFSIIVPCYNQAQYLEECIQSVIAQTYDNWECIIIDDNSPDNTKEVAQRLISDINIKTGESSNKIKIKYINTNKGGNVSYTRNLGIENAQGEWILPLDADDKIETTLLEKAVMYIEQGYDLICPKQEKFGVETGATIFPPFDRDKILYRNFFHASSIFPKVKWEQIGGYDPQLVEGSEDWEFWINMVRNTPTKVMQMEEIGFYYRIKKCI